jgi:two-component system CheB/CheR fusion protein
MAATDVATVFLDENLKIRKFTPQLSKLFHIIGGDVGRPFVHLAHRLEDVDPIEVVAKVIRSGSKVAKQVRTKDGDTYFMQVMPYKVDSGSPSGILITFFDIAPLKSVERDLREATTVLTKTQELARIGTWRLDLESNKLTWSKGTYDIFGLAEDKGPATYQDFMALVHPEDRERVHAEYQSTVKNRTPYDVVHRIVRPDGAIRLVHEVSSEFLDEGGRMIASLGFVHDITETPALLCETCPKGKELLVHHAQAAMKASSLSSTTGSKPRRK